MASPSADADVIHSAIAGLGTDDARLIDVITHRPNIHLQEVARVYQTVYNKPLLADIRGDTSGDYKDFLVSLVQPRADFIAETINRAIKGLGTDEAALIDALAFTCNLDIKAAEAAYQRLYGRPMITDIAGDTSGNFLQALRRLASGVRDEIPGNPQQAVKDADDLYAKGEGRLGTDDDFFIGTLCGRSILHIREIDQAYQAKYGKPLAAAVKKETSGDFSNLLVALASPPEVYWARRVHNAVAGLGTKDRVLQRVFVLNNKAQLTAIAQAYHREFKQSLEDAVRGDTSGEYQSVFLNLLN